MRIEFPYEGIAGVDVPDKNLLGVFGPRKLPSDGLPSERSVVERGFASPIGTPRIKELARGKKRAVLVVDDATRTTPAHLILPALLEELKAGGIAESAVTILTGLGTHRAMTEKELGSKLGPDMLKRLAIQQHMKPPADKLTSLGRTQGGTDIWVNSLAADAPLLLVVGHIVPHRVGGFSGGSKMIQPGICGWETTGQTHYLSAMRSGMEINGIRDNPVRREMDSVARAVGVAAIVNAVQDGTGRLVELVVGDVEEAHRFGCLKSREIFAANMPRRADIVIVESYPADLMLWQAAKGVYASELAVRKGGVVILVTPCPEGVSPEHPTIEEFGYRSVGEVVRLVSSGKVKDLVAAAHMGHVGRIIQDWARGILVSPGIGAETARRTGFIPAADATEALEKALGLMGRDATVAVLRHGGEILPVPAEA